jgi:hypothetical protein
MSIQQTRAQHAATIAHMDALNLRTVPPVKPMNELLVFLLTVDRRLSPEEAAYVAGCEARAA